MSELTNIPMNPHSQPHGNVEAPGSVLPVLKGTTVELDETVIGVMGAAAGFRLIMKGKSGDFMAEHVRCIAAFACAKLLNVCFDFTGGTECLVSPSGKKLAVMATQNPDDKLIATPEESQSDTEIYVLMVGTHSKDWPPVKFKYAGYATRAEVISPRTLGDLGHGPVHVLTQDQLH